MTLVNGGGEVGAQGADNLRPKKIYIVTGNCGEYSDYREWPVAAYDDEALARAHAEAAKQWFNSSRYAQNPYEYHDEENSPRNPFDPGMDTSYTGTDWSVWTVEFRTALPSLERDPPEVSSGEHDTTSEPRSGEAPLPTPERTDA